MNLKKRWFELCQELGILNGLEIFSLIEEKYTEPHRDYHGYFHLTNLFRLLDELKKRGVRVNYLAIALAIFMHDIVHNIPGEDNEEQSAEALKMIRFKKLDEKLLALVRSMILFSKHTLPPPKNYTVRIFLDMDFWILGSSRYMYSKHSKKIRKEYGMYSDADFLAGRTNFLNVTLEKKRMFHTGLFYKLYEKQAQKNISAELKRLKTWN